MLQPFQKPQKNSLGGLTRLLRPCAARAITLHVLGHRRPRRRPLRRQRLDHHRLDDLADGLRIGEVRAQLRPQRRVQAALEQRAENRRLNRRPVHPRRRPQRRRFGFGQRQRRGGLKQTAVKPGDVLQQKITARTHGGEQLRQPHRQLFRLAGALLDDPLEQPRRQQPHVLGEHAEQALNQEMGDRTRVMAPLRQRGGDGGETASRFLRDLVIGAAGPKLLRVLEQRAQPGERLRLADLFQPDAVNLRWRTGEMSVNLDAQAVADHQQRRVIQRQRIGHQLLQRRRQIAARRFVLPGEAAALPHIRPAAPSPGPRRAALETVMFQVVRLADAQQLAQIEEKRLCAGPLAQRVVAPGRDEISGGHEPSTSVMLRFRPARLARIIRNFWMYRCPNRYHTLKSPGLRPVGGSARRRNCRFTTTYRLWPRSRNACPLRRRWCSPAKFAPCVNN